MDLEKSAGAGDGPPSPRGEIAILFSGGLDTTLEVAMRLGRYEVVHLVTFDNGLCVNMAAARRRAAELGACFGAGRLRHAVVDTAPLMRRLLRDRDELWRRYRSPLVFDLACKMAALTALIGYARRHGIADISDGSSRDQTQIFLQHPDFAAHAKAFPAAYGLRYLPTVGFGARRGEKLNRLRELGLRSGWPFLEKLHITSQIRHQPFCLRGFVTYFFTSPTRHLGIVRRHGLPMEKAKELWDLLLPEARRHLDRELAGPGTGATAPSP